MAFTYFHPRSNHICDSHKPHRLREGTPKMPDGSEKNNLIPIDGLTLEIWTILPKVVIICRLPTQYKEMKELVSIQSDLPKEAFIVDITNLCTFRS